MLSERSGRDRGVNSSFISLGERLLTRLPRPVFRAGLYNSMCLCFSLHGGVERGFHFVMSNVFVNNALTRLWANGEPLLGAAKDGLVFRPGRCGRRTAHRATTFVICSASPHGAWFSLVSASLSRSSRTPSSRVCSLAFITATLAYDDRHYGVRTYQGFPISMRHSFLPITR